MISLKSLSFLGHSGWFFNHKIDGSVGLVFLGRYRTSLPVESPSDRYLLDTVANARLRDFGHRFGGT